MRRARTSLRSIGSGTLSSALRYLLTFAMLSGAWVWLYKLNAMAFDWLAISWHASAIFLPAALRILYPLAFGARGIAALVFAGYIVIPQYASDPLHRLALAALSGLAPVAGIAASNRIMYFSPDLSNLTGRHILLISTACALSNAVFLNAYLWLAGSELPSFAHIGMVFLGDVSGAAIVFFGLSLILNLKIKARFQP